jgi:hypothetical protein
MDDAFASSGFSVEVNERRGNRFNQQRLNTALCDANEYKDWCIVILYIRTEDPLFLSVAFGFGSSKNFRQSSSSASAPSSGSGSSSSSEEDGASWAPAFDFGFLPFFLALGGLVPNPSIHHEFSWEDSAGNDCIRSRKLSRLAGACRCEVFAMRVLRSMLS